jgi:hypothetical protein
MCQSPPAVFIVLVEDVLEVSLQQAPDVFQMVFPYGVNSFVQGHMWSSQQEEVNVK